MALAKKFRKEKEINEAQLDRYNEFKGDMRTELYRTSFRR